MGGEYAPFTTSYDYDAPLSEDGRPTPKFNAIKKRLRALEGDPAARLPPPTFVPLPPPPLAAYRRVELTEWLPLLTCDAVTTRTAAAVRGEAPLTMEALPMAHGGRYARAGQRHGFLLYRTTLQHASARAVTLRLPEVHDRAQVRRRWCGVGGAGGGGPGVWLGIGLLWEVVRRCQWLHRHTGPPGVFMPWFHFGSRFAPKGFCSVPAD